MTEVPLPGGDVTEGVVRVDDTVRRPLGPHSPLVHAVLNHLENVRFSGAPRFFGIDGKGRETLTFVDGEVAVRPWPGWVADEARIISVAKLVRAFDDAMEPFGVPDDLIGHTQRPEPDGCPPRIPLPQNLIGHQDVTPENVVFRSGQAHALIDFDMLRPAAREEEVVNVLLWWAPLMPPDDRESALSEVDAMRRVRLIVDAYGLAERDRLPELIIRMNERAWFLMRWRAQTQGGGWQRMWDEGVGDVIERRTTWLRERTDELGEALG
ncbi:phosphotransferase [Luteipulveratus mongoliensis]|nr:phosphotransferase [Luteipulveratus mongoliensis]